MARPTRERIAIPAAGEPRSGLLPPQGSAGRVETGSYVLSIAGYNVGKARVTSWTTTRGDPRDPKVDVINWIGSIPFDETRNYVMRVLENELAYTTRLGEALQAKELNLTLRRLSP